MKKINNIPTVAIIIMLLFACSCSKKNYPQQSNSNFTLAVGNTWTYTETYYFNNIWDSLRSTRNVVRTITKDTLLAESQLAYVVEETTGNNTYRYMWYEKDDQLIQANFNYEHLNILIAANLEKGLVWDMWPSLDRQNQNDEKTVSEEFTSYPILGKNLSAFRLQQGIKDLLVGNKTGDFTEQVYAPAIGIVEETYYSNYYGPTRTHRILTSYSIQ